MLVNENALLRGVVVVVVVVCVLKGGGGVWGRENTEFIEAREVH